MTEISTPILADPEKLIKLTEALPIGSSAIRYTEGMASIFEKRQIPFTIQDGFIILGAEAAEWFNRQFSG